MNHPVPDPNMPGAMRPAYPVRPTQACPVCYHEVVPEDDRCNCTEKDLRAEIKRLQESIRELTRYAVKRSLV